MATYAVWQNTLVSLSSYLDASGKCAYIIKNGSTVIYNGVAYARPDGSCNVRLNDFAAPLLSQSLPNLSGTTSSYNGSVTLSIYAGSTLVATHTFFYDWSYESQPSPRHAFINSLLDSRMPQIVTNSNTQNTVTAAGAGVNTGAKFALYYVNKYGGWDWLVCNDIPTRAESIERESFLSERTEIPYAGKVTRSWVLHTGLLTDAGAKNITHLLASPLVYLYDLATTNVVRVNVKDSSFNELNYRNNSNKAAQYTINVQMADTMLIQ